MRHDEEQNCIDGEKVVKLQNWLAKGTLSTNQFKSRHCAQSAAIIKQYGQEGYEVSTHLPVDFISHGCLCLLTCCFA